LLVGNIMKTGNGAGRKKNSPTRSNRLQQLDGDALVTHSYGPRKKKARLDINYDKYGVSLILQGLMYDFTVLYHRFNTTIERGQD
jgi:hypothetical protein